MHHRPVGGEVKDIRPDPHALSVPRVGDGANRVSVEASGNERAMYPVEQTVMVVLGELETVEQVRKDDVDGPLRQFGEEPKGFPAHRAHPGPSGDRGADARYVDADDREAPSAEGAEVASVPRTQLDPRLAQRATSWRGKHPAEERAHARAEEARVRAIPGVPVASLSSWCVGRSEMRQRAMTGRGHEVVTAEESGRST